MLCNDKNNGGFGCINIKNFLTGLKLSWLRRYAIQQIDDHWCDILDTECGITNKKDRIKISHSEDTRLPILWVGGADTTKIMPPKLSLAYMYLLHIDW